MGGYRKDGRLLERLREISQEMFDQGRDDYSDDLDEAIERLKPIYAPCQCPAGFCADDIGTRLGTDPATCRIALTQRAAKPSR